MYDSKRQSTTASKCPAGSAVSSAPSEASGGGGAAASTCTASDESITRTSYCASIWGVRVITLTCEEVPLEHRSGRGLGRTEVDRGHPQVCVLPERVIARPDVKQLQRRRRHRRRLGRVGVAPRCRLAGGSVPPVGSGGGDAGGCRSWRSVAMHHSMRSPLPPSALVQCCSQKGVRLAQKMQVGPSIPVGTQL
jgi:hypothetical protein